jgi:hypothetical protein
MLCLLPPELWLQIADHLSRHDLNVLTRSNRSLCTILLPTLHRDITLRGDRLPEDEVCETLTRISNHPNLFRATRTCTLDRASPISLDSAILSFKSFPNLSDITLTRTSVDETQLDQLLMSINKHPFSLKLSVCEFKACNTPEVAKPPTYSLNGPLPRFASLSVVHSVAFLRVLPLLIYWTTAPTLKHLWFFNYSEIRMPDILSECLEQPFSVFFPMLKTLRLSAPSHIDIRVFGLMPMLEELSFIKYERGVFANLPALPEQYLRRLHHYEGAAESVMRFVLGRPIRSLILSVYRQPFYYSSLGTPTVNLGSLTTIRCLALLDTTYLLDALKFAVSACPDLYELKITQENYGRFTPVCWSPVASFKRC